MSFSSADLINAVQQPCDDVAARIIRHAQTLGLSISCAESLTGGLLADAFVRIPGASDVFVGSAVTYATESKASVLQVNNETLQRYGAVHAETVRQMVTGVGVLFRSTIQVATTGVAGPTQQDGQPVGRFYIGLLLPGMTHAEVVTGRISDDEIEGLAHGGSDRRECIRRVVVAVALTELLRCLGRITHKQGCD
ncbi:CinA family protein [Timonella sp. A28]|uniref:CinA family protein n=1 Tax=Timonella sp. A28 TaxID=3442640 RepID=UPI003EBAF8E1